MTTKRFRTRLTIVAIVLTASLLLLELVFSATARDQLSLSQLVRETGPSTNAKSSIADTFTININIEPPTATAKVRVDEGVLPPSYYGDNESFNFSQDVELRPDSDSRYWKFVKWTFSGSDNFDVPLTLSPTQGYDVTASFTRTCFNLTLTHVEGGEVGVNPALSSTSEFCTAGIFAAGEPITLSVPDIQIIEAGGWRIADWTINDVSLNNDAQTITVNMPPEASTIAVVYEPICYQLTSRPEPPGSGTISSAPPPGCPVTTPGNWYFVNKTVNLEALPAAGYEFVSWTGVSPENQKDNPLTVRMNEDHTIVANFQLACKRLNLEHLPAIPTSGEDPTTTSSSSVCTADMEFAAGDKLTLRANPNKILGWQMEGWENTGDPNTDASTAEEIQFNFPALKYDVVEYFVRAKYIKQPTLQFVESTYSVGENRGTVTLEVERLGSKLEEVNVDFRTREGSAKSGQEFEYQEDTLTFKKNETLKTITVTIIDDLLPDGDKDFFVELSSPQNGAALGDPSETMITIDDDEDEGPPRVSFSRPEFRVPEEAASAGITVTLSNTSTEVVGFVFDVAEGTATNEEDFSWGDPVAPNFPATTSSRVIQVPLLPDSMDEPDETIFLTIPNVFSGGGKLGQWTEATLIIEDDDDPPPVHFTDEAYFAREGDPTASISVTLETASSYPITVDYEVTKLSVGRQYAAQVTFPPGETLRVIDVPLDGYVAGDILEIQLDSAVNAILSPPASVTLTIFDKNRSDCYQLTLQSNGNGTPPVTTNLESSLGCRPGYFVRDQAVVVRAEPELGWEIERWSGTQNDEDTSDENVVVMPDGDHTVTVFYITHAYLPNLMQQFVSYFEGPDEVEPNNALSISQANGPLRSGREYHGGFASTNDQFDIYYVYLAQQGKVQVELTDIPSGRDYNLYLYSANAELKGYSGSLDNNNELISSGNLPKGVYYILVHVAGSAPSSAKYSLKTVYE